MASKPPLSPASFSTPTPSSHPLTLSATHRTALSPYLPPTTPTPPLRPNSPRLAQNPHSPHLPYLTLTYATSLDSQIALGPGLQTVLSGHATKAMTHYLRSVHDGILIGVGTAEIDDPGLNSRYAGEGDGDGDRGGGGGGGGGGQGRGAVGLEAQPVPIILDPGARWSCRRDCKVLRLAREGKGKPPFWVVGSRRAVQDGRFGNLGGVGGEVLVLEEIRGKGGEGDGNGGAEGRGVDWGLVLKCLAERGIGSVMVEGGRRVIEDLLAEGNQGFVNVVIVTVAPVWLGTGGVTVCPPRQVAHLEAGRLEAVKWIPMGEDVVLAGKLKTKRRGWI